MRNKQNMLQNSRTSYTAFYTYYPFWAIAPLDFSNEIDSIKFNELMANIEFEITCENITIRIAKDGLIEIQSINLENLLIQIQDSLDFDTLSKIWQDYLALCNWFYFLLDTQTILIEKIALFNFQEIQRTDISRITYENGKFSSSSIPNQSITGNYLSLRHSSQYKIGLPIMYQSEIMSRRPISNKTFEQTANFFFESIKIDQTKNHIATFCKAFSEYKSGNYRITIVLCWFIIESLIKDKYIIHLQSIPKERMNSKRKDYLLGRDFTAGIISQILEILQILTHEELVKLDLIRQLRNDIAHDLNKKEVGIEQCKVAIELSLKLMLEEKSSHCIPNFSLTAPGG